MNFMYRIWVYVMPFPMWLAEYFARTIMANPDVNDFFPSSLAATALGLIIPALAPKSVAPPQTATIPQGTLLVRQRDETVRMMAMLLLFCGTLLWMATVYLSIGGKWPTGWIGADVDQKLWIGTILYVMAFCLTEWKEAA
jgi:hypothetical protein